MSKVWIKFTKDYDTHKKDAIIELDEGEGNALVQLKIAEKTEKPDMEIIDGVMKNLTL